MTTRSNVFNAASVLMAVYFSVVAPIALAGSAAPESPADRLAALQAQKALNRVRLEVAKQEAEIRGMGTPPPAPPITHASKPADAPLPTLISISSVGDKVTGTVLVAGVRKAVKAGDALPGGWVIDKIDSGSMTVVRAGQSQVLRP